MIVEEVRHIYKTLPEDIRNAFFGTGDINTAEILQDIGKRNGIPAEQITGVSSCLSLIFLKKEPASNLKNLLATKLGIDDGPAQKISEEINVNIFQRLSTPVEDLFDKTEKSLDISKEDAAVDQLLRDLDIKNLGTSTYSPQMNSDQRQQQNISSLPSLKEEFGPQKPWDNTLAQEAILRDIEEPRAFQGSSPTPEGKLTPPKLDKSIFEEKLDLYHAAQNKNVPPQNNPRDLLPKEPAKSSQQDDTIEFYPAPKKDLYRESVE